MPTSISLSFSLTAHCEGRLGFWAAEKRRRPFSFGARLFCLSFVPLLCHWHLPHSLPPLHPSNLLILANFSLHGAISLLLLWDPASSSHPAPLESGGGGGGGGGGSSIPSSRSQEGEATLVLGLKAQRGGGGGGRQRLFANS